MTSPQLGKNNFKAPSLPPLYTYFIKVLPKINAVTMNMSRGLAEIELVVGPEDRKSSNPLQPEVGGHLPLLLMLAGKS